MSKKKKPKRVTETHSVVMNTGRKLNIYIDDQKIGQLKETEFHKVKLDKN